MIEFKSNGASKESAIIQYFQDSLNPLVRVEKKQHGQEIDSCDEIVEKVVAAKAKPTLRSQFYICKNNQYSLRDSCLATTKSYIRGLLIKDSRAKESKARFQKPRVLEHQLELSEKAHKNWMRKGRRYDGDQK